MERNDYLPGSLQAREEESLDPNFDSIAAGRNAPSPKVRFRRGPVEKMEADKLDAFLLANHGHLTASDMVEELDLPLHVIGERCKKLGIKPITVKEQTRAYLKQYGGKRTLEQLARTLKVGKKHISDLCHEYGVVPLAEGEHTGNGWISPREVFSKASFRLWQ